MYQGYEEGAAGRFPFYPDTVPEELKDGRAWLCCDAEKVPFVAQFRGERLASSTNPATWRTFSHAAEAWSQGLYAGVGRVIESDGPFVGLDFDDCRSPRSGELTRWGESVLEELNSYSEASPSQTGVKVWVRADISATHIRKEGENPIEVYPGGRYFTVTGQLLPQYSSGVEERTEELNALIAREFPGGGPPQRPHHYSGPVDPGFTIEEYLEDAGVDVLAEVPDNLARIKFRVVCPWIDEHTRHAYSGSYAGQYGNGALFFECWHGHCNGRRWQDFRNETSPKLKVRISLPGYTGGPLEVCINHG